LKETWFSVSWVKGQGQAAMEILGIRSVLDRLIDLNQKLTQILTTLEIKV